MNDHVKSHHKAKRGQLVLSKAVQKELADIPEKKRNQFLFNLEMALAGMEPGMAHEKLKAAGDGVIELKINGRPAYRCMYTRRKNGDVVVLHATEKTAQGQDKQLVKTTSQRLKQLGQDKG